MRCETAEALADGRIVSPSAERNKGPIAEILMRVLPAQGEVLEVSSGTGQHVLHFAQAMPHIRWQPTERDADSLKSIASWLGQTSAPNVNAPLRLDVHDASWPAHDVAAVVCINMIHIAPSVGGEGLDARRRQRHCFRRAYCFSTAHIAGKDGTPHPATKPSTCGSRLGIRNGASATWKMLSISRAPWVSSWSRPMTCPRTTFLSSFASPDAAALLGLREEENRLEVRRPGRSTKA